MSQPPYDVPQPQPVPERTMDLFQCRQGGPVRVFEGGVIGTPVCSLGCGALLRVGPSSIDEPHSHPDHAPVWRPTRWEAIVQGHHLIVWGTGSLWTWQLHGGEGMRVLSEGHESTEPLAKSAIASMLRNRLAQQAPP